MRKSNELLKELVSSISETDSYNLTIVSKDRDIVTFEAGNQVAVFKEITKNLLGNLEDEFDYDLDAAANYLETLVSELCYQYIKENRE